MGYTRLIEFMIGMNLAYILLMGNIVYTSSSLKWTLAEIGSLVFVIFSILIAFNYRNIVITTESGKWWSHSIVYLIPTIIFIYVFSNEKGYVAHNLGSIKVIQKIANGSTYAFLIHYVVFKYINAFF